MSVKDEPWHFAAMTSQNTSTTMSILIPMTWAEAAGTAHRVPKGGDDPTSSAQAVRAMTQQVETQRPDLRPRQGALHQTVMRSRKTIFGREPVDLPSGQARRAKKSKPGHIPARDSRPKNSAKRERNSGPARDESRNTPRGRAIDETENRNRSFSLLRRFRRRESAAGANADSSAKPDKARPKLFAALGVSIGKIRKRFSAGQAAVDNQAARSAGKSQKPAVNDKRERSIRAAFGASRGETREGRRKAPSEAASSARFDRKPAKDPPENAAQRPRPSKAPIFEKNDWLDLDRKLDLIGVGLVFGAIVLFFSALSSEQAAISAVNTLIGQLLGWGAMAVPFTMFAIGMWLIIRHFGDQAPTVDPIRLAGVIIAFSGALVLFQFLESFSYSGFIAAVGQCAEECMRVLAQASYQGGRGGGFVGAWSYLMLVNNLTEVGGFIVVLMVLTFSAMMITRMTMAEIAIVAIGFARGLRGKMAEQAVKQRARRMQAQQQMAFAQQDTTLHVSKPAARELPGSVQGIHALPEADIGDHAHSQSLARSLDAARCPARRARFQKRRKCRAVYRSRCKSRCWRVVAFV